MQETLENGKTSSDTSIICGRTFNVSDFSETAKECGNKFADAASRAGDYVSEKVNAVGNKIKDLQGKDISEIADEAKDYARKNPGQAILITAVAGVVLGFLLRGRR
jgi:ElaB/YqjD/DUF883 family membrane-anchored ribosome-binding protein